MITINIYNGNRNVKIKVSQDSHLACSDNAEWSEEQEDDVDEENLQEFDNFRNSKTVKII